MRLLFLQFVAPGSGEAVCEFSHALGVLAGTLRAQGHECSLAAMPGYRSELLREAVIRHRPQQVLVELRPHSVAAAHRAIVDLAETFALPAVVWGPYATCFPEKAVSIPGVEALFLGECEGTAAAYFGALESGSDPAGTAGLWAHGDEGLVKGEAPSLIEDLDGLPFPDRELFDYARTVGASRQVHFKAARGCPLWCGHCFNDWYMDLYADERGEAPAPPFVRRRSVGNVLEEVAAVVRRYDGAESAVFYDHCFAMDETWLEEFAAGYPRRCALPFRCHVRLERLGGAVPGMLAAAGCRAVEVHLGSGSRFIREELLCMEVSDEQIVAGCRALRRAGLRVEAEVFVGCPYESEITVEETMGLARRAQVDALAPVVYYPTPGTRAAEVCAENGWISGRGEENFWLQQSVLDMPSMPAGQIAAARQRLAALWGRPGRTALRNLLDRVGRRRRRGASRLAGKRSPRGGR